MQNPAIIIIGFNRPSSIRRLLLSISKANYSGQQVKLCICIDYNGSKDNDSVINIAKSFKWEHGEKSVVVQKENLGLKEHVLRCGDLVNKYGSIIMLEDDLYVSPHYYSYTVDTLSFYANDKNIGGISLYNHKINFNNQTPFDPFEDGYDVFFMQIASSWGQAWTSNQWNEFRQWLTVNPIIDSSAMIPDFIIGWPDSSWLKYFINYLSSNNKYFVYPRSSYTTNFGDQGSNNLTAKPFFQVPLQMKERRFRFVNFDDSFTIYDSYFELSPDTYKQYNTKLSPFDFDVDLNGLKSLKKIKAPFVLTCKYGTNPIIEFGLNLKPIELNVIENIPGNLLKLESKKTLSNENLFKNLANVMVFNYLYGLIPTHVKLKNAINIIKNKLLKNA